MYKVAPFLTDLMITRVNAEKGCVHRKLFDAAMIVQVGYGYCTKMST